MIVAIVSRKGGVGRTTTAFHLCAYWAQKGLNCVLIDGDPNHSALNWANRPGKSLPFTVIEQLDQVRFFMSREHPPEIAVMDTRVCLALDNLRTWARCADLLIIPSTPDASSLETLPILLRHLAQLPRIPYKVLITDMPPKPSTDGPDAIAWLQKQRVPTFGTGIRHYAAFKKAALAGVTVDEVRDPNAAKGWADYRSVGEECDRWAQDLGLLPSSASSQPGLLQPSSSRT